MKPSLDFNHVGISVPDIDRAMAWYSDVLGFAVISGPTEIDFQQPSSGEQALDVLGRDFRHMRMAHLVSPNGIGIELFHLIEPPHQPHPGQVEYWRGGIFHLCLTVDDIEAMTEKIVSSGGKQLSKIWLERPPSPEFKMVYCADPFGTVIELYTHDYRTMQQRR